MDRDPYLILNVSPIATGQQIQQAYRRLARIYHPDINERGDADQRMQEINWAYEILKDPEKKAAYDLARPASAARRTAPAASSRPYWREQNPTPATGTWGRSRRPASAPRSQAWIDPRVLKGMAVALLANAFFILAGAIGVCFGPFAALGAGCWIASSRSVTASKQNGGWVGMAVGFETVLVPWLLNPAWVDGSDGSCLLLMALGIALILGVAFGGLLGSFMGQYKAYRSVVR